MCVGGAINRSALSLWHQPISGSSCKNYHVYHVALIYSRGSIYFSFFLLRASVFLCSSWAVSMLKWEQDNGLYLSWEQPLWSMCVRLESPGNNAGFLPSWRKHLTRSRGCTFTRIIYLFILFFLSKFRDRSVGVNVSQWSAGMDEHRSRGDSAKSTSWKTYFYCRIEVNSATENAKNKNKTTKTPALQLTELLPECGTDLNVWVISASRELDWKMPQWEREQTLLQPHVSGEHFQWRT